MLNEILKSIPDFSSWKDALLWLQEGQNAVQRISPQYALDADAVSMEWKEIEQKSEAPFGLYAVENWRKFVLATFLADLASYQQPVDQVSFDRLLFVMHAFPQGFRTWWIKISNRWWPVGYTGWYPMFQTMYDIMRLRPESLRNRMVLPNTHSTNKPYLYLFNFSVAPMFKGSDLAKILMKRYVIDIIDQNARGMACITVSDDGVRISTRLGMACTGYLKIDGIPEGVYIK